MSIVIRDPEIERLARELAAATGQRISHAIRDALRDALHRVTIDTRPSIVAKVRRVQARIARLPVLDARPVAELVRFDEHGLPV